MTEPTALILELTIDEDALKALKAVEFESEEEAATAVLDTLTVEVSDR